MTKKTVGFIGIGLMGSQMARRILNAGHQVQIWNRNIEKCAELGAQGAIVAQSAKEAADGADIVITMLSDAAAVRDVYLGSGDVASVCKNAITIDMSSQAPDTAIQLHSELDSLGVAHLDAPVSGGVSGAADGTLSIMAGGEEKTLNAARPILEIMGNVFHLGAAGAGQTCKLVNQTIVHITIGAVSEGLLLASALGVDAGKVREAISGGYCQSRILDIHGEKIVNRDFTPGGPLQFSVKDLSGAMAQADQAVLDLPLTQSVLENYKSLVASGWGHYDHSALVMAYEDKNTPHKVSPDKKDVTPG